MAYYSRRITIAEDSNSHEIIQADILFEHSKDAFEARQQVQTRKLNLICCECYQPLTISSSKYDRLHFKHYPNHAPCPLTGGKLTDDDLEKFSLIYAAKESARHKELKNKIASRLRTVDGVDISSITIDDKFIIRDNGKRRPDVYCRYLDKEIVFEIQLSDLSLNYIYSRHEFYAQNGIYLVWMLDQYDIHAQSPMERDIKYLAPYQNFFKLDETTKEFALLCDYKEPMLTADNRLLTPWKKVSVPFNKISFDEQQFQIFYYNYPEQIKIKEQQRAKTEEIKREEASKRIEKMRLDNAQKKVDKIISEIKTNKQHGMALYDYVQMAIDELDHYETSILNKRLRFTDPSRTQTALPRWLKEASRNDHAFLNFILSNQKIALDVNERSADETTSFMELCNNKNLIPHAIIPLLFIRGYQLTDTDRTYIQDMLSVDPKSPLAIAPILDRIKDRRLVPLAIKYSNLIYIIESAKLNTIYGFNFKPDQWVIFANNAIEYYKEHWTNIEHAFRRYNIWDMIRSADKNGTFKAKLQRLHTYDLEEDYKVEPVLIDLYPDIYGSNSAT